MSGRTFIRRRGTTPIPNATVYDDRLSYAALGLLAVLLARPDGSPSGYRDLQGRGLGKDATLRALRELSAAGYRYQLTVKASRGRLVTHTVVSESPITQGEAREWLEEVALRAVDISDAVRRNSAHGVTRDNAASSQVAPRGGSPEHGPPEPGQPPHNPKGFQGVTHYVRNTGKTNARARTREPSTPPERGSPPSIEHACPHGMPGGLAPLATTDKPRCPLCRTGTG